MGPSRIGKDNPPAPEEFCSPRHRRVRHGCPVSPRQIGVDRKDGHVHPTSKLAFRCLPRGHQRGNLGSELLSLRLVAQQQLPCIFQLGFVCGLKRIWCQPVVKRAACTRRDLFHTMDILGTCPKCHCSPGCRLNVHSQLWRTSEGRCVEEVASLKVTGLGTVEEKHSSMASPIVEGLLSHTEGTLFEAVVAMRCMSICLLCSW